MKKRIAILTNLIPTYRRGFYNNILNTSNGYEVTVFCQNRAARSNLKGINSEYPDHVREIPFLSIGGEKVVWHFLPFFTLLFKYDIIIADGNPRHLSQAILSTIAKFFSKKVVIWSTYHSRRNKSFDSRLRRAWWKIFDYFLGYTEWDSQKLIEAGFEERNVVAINNGLNQNVINSEKIKWADEELKEWQKEKNIFGKTVLISTGRVLENKYQLILETLPNLVSYDNNLVWVLIGDGEGMHYIKEKVAELGLESNVYLVGAVYDESELAPWFLSSTLFVYSDPIGLSLMHAFGYGLPVVIHDNISTHGPEVTIFENEKTGLTFNEDDRKSFFSAVKTLLNSENKRNEISSHVSSIVNDKYNTDQMAKNFYTLIQRIDND